MLVFDTIQRSAYSSMKRIFRANNDGNSKRTNEEGVEPVIVESMANAAATTITLMAPEDREIIDHIR